MHIVKYCQLAIFTPRRQIFPPCFKGNRISTCQMCSTKTSQSYSSFVLMNVRHIFDRVCLQRVHFSFLRTLTCLKVQLLYILVKSSTQVQRSYLLHMCAWTLIYFLIVLELGSKIRTPLSKIIVIKHHIN
jgi:hypothetical protein